MQDEGALSIVSNVELMFHMQSGQDRTTPLATHTLSRPELGSVEPTDDHRTLPHLSMPSIASVIVSSSHTKSAWVPKFRKVAHTCCAM